MKPVHAFYCFLLPARQPPVGQDLLIHEVSRSHTTTHHSQQDFSGRVISSLQRPLPDNTQHSQQTNFHAPGGIQAHNPSRRAAPDLRLRPRGHLDHQVHTQDAQILGTAVQKLSRHSNLAHRIVHPRLVYFNNTPVLRLARLGTKENIVSSEPSQKSAYESVSVLIALLQATLPVTDCMPSISEHQTCHCDTSITALHKAKALIYYMFTKYRMTKYYKHVYKQCELF